MTFFSVDPEAGFAAVARHQLGGPWQVPAEIVRFGAAYGAGAVEVSVGRRTIFFRIPGPAVPRSILAAAAAAMGEKDGIRRLKALGELEDRQATVLAWVAGTEPTALVVELRGPDGGAVLRWSRGGSISFEDLPRSGERILRVSITGGSIDRGKARQWLRSACRFSRIPVSLNGVDLRKGLDSGSFRARLKAPLPADVALGVDRENPRLWLLRHGIVETRVTVPGWPPFEAAVELAGEVDGWAAAADLRQALKPHLSGLVSGVIDLLLRVVPRLEELGRERQQRILRALLVGVVSGIREGDISRAEIIELVGRGGARRLSLGDLKRGRGPLPKVCDPAAVEMEVSEGCLVLGSRERDLASEILGVALESTAPRRPSKIISVKRLAESIRGVLSRLIGPRAVPADRLGEEEKDLAAALESGLETDGGPAEVRFVRGRGDIRWSRHVLFLPRLHTSVVHSLAALRRDRSHFYAVALALAPPTWRIAPRLREGWLGRWNSGRGGDGS